MKGKWIIASCVIMALVILAGGFIFTKDKAESNAKEKSVEETTKEEPVENEGCMDMITNPLELENQPEVSTAVKGYYNEMQENADFVESYENIQVYTKLGKYEGTYVAFARYEMKIKDIYTKVPGLGTLYIDKDPENGNVYVETEEIDEETKEYVQAIAAHEDVRQLMSQIQNDYANAVASDALLNEALQDLKNAYENQ